MKVIHEGAGPYQGAVTDPGSSAARASGVAEALQSSIRPGVVGRFDRPAGRLAGHILTRLLVLSSRSSVALGDPPVPASNTELTVDAGADDPELQSGRRRVASADGFGRLDAETSASGPTSAFAGAS